MFREFNVKFEDVEIIGGSDNLLEGTEVTKVILRGDSKMSSLDSALKNCSELDTIDGDLDLNGVNDIDNLLEGTPLVKEISVKNVNVEDMSCDNSFTNIDTLNIAGDSKKKAIQNLLGNMDWEFDGVNYTGDMVDVVTDKMEVLTDEECNVEVVDALEQKVRSLEIKGQTYKNLIDGKEEKELVDNFITTVVDDNTSFEDTVERDLKIIEIQGNTLQNLIDGEEEVELIDDFRAAVSDDNTSFNETYYTREVKISEIKGNTLQNLVDGKGKYTLTDTYNEAWTESNNIFENMPSMIEIPEIHGNTVQGFANCVSYKQIADCVNSLFNSNPKVFEDGLQGGDNTANVSTILDAIANSENPIPITLKGNTTYSIYVEAYNLVGFITTRTNQLASLKQNSCTKFTTDSTGEIFIGYGLTYNNKFKIRVVEGDIDLTQYPFDYDLSYIQSVGDLYVDEEGSPILDEEGNEQYKLDVVSSNTLNLIDINEGCTMDGGEAYFNTVIDSSKVKKFTCIYKHDMLGHWFKPRAVSSEGVVGSVFINRQTKSSDVVSNGVYRIQFSVPSNVDRFVIQLSHFSGGNNIQVTVGHNTLPFLESVDTKQSNKTTILMPQPLRKVGKYSDKLYWDYNSKRYFIENNVKEVFGTKERFTPTDDYLNADPVHFYDYTTYLDEDLERYAGDIITNLRGCTGMKATSSINFYISREVLGLDNTNTKNEYRARLFQLMNEQGVRYIFRLVTPKTIETKILEKPSLETYSPKTYVSTNTEVQPSQMTITNKRNLFTPLGLQADKDYTLQLDSVGKDDKNITVNLGGTETTIQPINDTSKHHKVVIRTPSELTTDKLELSGKGVVVNDVMLFDGGSSVMKQNVEYVDGIQSIGELQENGKYKIDIQTKTDVLYEEEYEMTDKLVIEDTKDIGHVRVDKIIGNSLVNLLLDPYVTDFKYGNINDYTWGNTGTSTIQNGVVTHTGTTSLTGYTRQKVAVKPNTSYYGFARVKLNYTGENLDKCNFGVCINGERTWSPSNTYISSRDKVTSNTNGYVEVSCRIDNVDHTHLMFSLDCSGIIGEVSFKDFYMIELPSNELYPTTSWEGLKSTFEEGLVTQDQVDNGQELEENLDKYKADIKVTGKNKYSFDKLTRVVNTTNYIMQLTPNTTYHIKGYVDEALISDRPYVSLYANGISIGWVHLGIKQYIDNTFTTGDDGQVRFWCSDRNVIMKYLEIGAIKFQIEEGSVATNYQQYYEETQSIYLNSPLLKGDEIVMKDGELCHYHNMEVVKVDGGENWVEYVDTQTNCRAFYMNRSYLSKNVQNDLCYGNISKYNDDFMIGNLKEDKEGFVIAGDYLKVSVLKKRLTSNNKDGFVEWLKENNILLVYKLEEPYYEPLNQNQINIDTPNSKSYVSINSLIPTQNANVTYLEYGICNNSIELDEPLRAIGNVRDKLYWDWYEGKYVIERNIGKVILNGSENWFTKWNDFNDSMHFFLRDQSYIKNLTGGFCDRFIVTKNSLEYDKTLSEGICRIVDWGVNPIVVRILKSRLETIDAEGFKKWLQNNPTEVIYELATPTKEYISLPKQNTKTYAPVTYLTMPNIPLKTDISIDTDIQKYRPMSLSANTKYTVFLDSVGDNDIKVELGGKVETITPSMEHGQNKVIITTPSTLSHNDLYVSGAGSNVKNVMLMQNEITQSPEYIDSIQSVGENVENEHLGTLVNLGEGNRYKNIFINEIHGDTYKGSSLGELIVDEFGDPVLDDNGDKQYTFKIKISNHPFGKGGRI